MQAILCNQKGYDLDISENILLLAAAVVIISSIWSLTVMTENALAAPDKFGTDKLYSIADEDDDEVKLELRGVEQLGQICLPSHRTRR